MTTAAGQLGGRPGLRVLHLMPTNFGMTGVETFILQLCVAQRRLGLEPALAMDLTDRSEVAEACAAMGTPVHDLADLAHPEVAAGPWPARKIRSAVRRLRLVGRLADLARRSDLLHVHSVGFSSAEGLLGAVLGARRPAVVTHHTVYGYEARRATRVVGFWLERRLASRLLVPYARAAEEYRAAGAARDLVEVVPFCVDERRFTAAPARPPAPGGLHLVFSARLFEGKEHDHLLEAMARLRPRYPGLRATFVGDGPTRPEIEARIDRLGLRDAVTLTGRVAHAAVPDLLRAAHLIVLPSHMEGETFPLCLLEGMATGLPAIGSRWTGIPDIIEDGVTGLLVPPANVEALVEAIERFHLDRSFLIEAGRRARARFEAHFSSTAVAARYAGIYASAGARPPGAETPRP